NSLAFYSLIILFLMGITGPQWSFPWYRTALQKTLGTYKEAPARTNPPSSQRPSNNADKTEQAAEAPPSLLAIEQYLASADEALPYKGDYSVSIPSDADSPVQISKNRVGF